jgi:hydroxymethylpyrimidine/phosphomethylpyrimidine kinase
MANPIPIALTIAGSDSGGGAGIQADLKTFSAFCVYGASVLTALTAQNTIGVQGVELVAPSFVLMQLESVLSDLDVRAAKTGMLATAAIVEAVAGRMGTAKVPLVVDPVMVATSGDVLLNVDAIAAVKTKLIPRARVLTPNLPEAARLLDTGEARNHEEVVAQGRALLKLGASAVLMKDGHGRGAEVVDVLLEGDAVHRFAKPRIGSKNTHGTGCTLSAAIAAGLAKGLGLIDAVAAAQDYVWKGITAGEALGVGQGQGPVDHLWALRSGVRLG